MQTFNSQTGKRYIINKNVPNNVEHSKMLHIIRESGEPWPLDLRGVLKAYRELTDFKTGNFKPYVFLELILHH